MRTLECTPKLKQEQFLVAHQAERSGEGMSWIVGLIKDVLIRNGVVL